MRVFEKVQVTTACHRQLLYYLPLSARIQYRRQKSPGTAMVSYAPTKKKAAESILRPRYLGSKTTILEFAPES